MMSLLIGIMMMIAIIIVLFGPQFVSSSMVTTHTVKLSQDKEDHQDQDQRLLQSVGLPSISNQLTTLRHAPLELLSSQVNANSIEALSSSIPDYEMQALKDFYDSTDGDNWELTDEDVHWDFTDDNANPCATYSTWHGLSCTYYSSSGIVHVTGIQLVGSNLYGSLPNSLGRLSKLTSLGLYNGNSVTGTLPDSLGNLVELTWLNLDGNQLIGTIPASLGKLSKLYFLCISSNFLTGTLPASLGKLSKLTELYLYDNSLTGTLPASLGQLSRLNVLGIYYNSLTGTLPASLGQLSKLYFLGISSNSLTGTLPDSLRQLSELTSLDLYNNQLIGSIPASLGQLSELTWLNVGNNQLFGSIPASLGQLSELTAMYLDGNSLTGTLPASLGQLLKLTGLYLYDNIFTGTIPNSFANLSDLTYLSLYDNQLSGTIPSSLCKCHEMYVTLYNNNFDCYPACMTSSHHNVQVDEDIPVCDDPTYNDVCSTESNTSKSTTMSMMIVWIILPITLILLVALSIYIYYRYRYRYAKISHNNQNVENNQNNNVIDEDNDHNRNHDVNRDLSTSEVPETRTRMEDISTLEAGTVVVVNDREITTVPSDAANNTHTHVLHSHNVITQGPSSYDSQRSMQHIDSHDIDNNESNNDHARRNDQRISHILGVGSDEYFESNYNYHAIRSYDEARRRMEGIDDYNDRETNEEINHNDRRRKEGNSQDRRRAQKRNGAGSESRHERRDNISQVQLEPVVRGELVSMVAGTAATDNEILNLPTAVANIDDQDVLYADLFSHV